MAEAAMELFPEGRRDAGQQHGTGILPYQVIKELVRSREILSPEGVESSQYQPASLDLRLGSVAYRVRASFLPGAGATVMQKIEQLAMHEFDLTRGAVLERGCVYIVPLVESLALGSRLSALANPKSSTGRLDVFTRVITDHGTAFDRVRPGYAGPLYAEIAPRTFSILVRKGSRVTQLRLRRGSPVTSAAELRRLQETVGLVVLEPGREPAFKEDTVGVTLDLDGDPATRLVGFRAKKHADVVDVDRRAHYDPLDYWEPIFARRGGIVLNPDDFYILATKEAVRVPPDYAAEMVAYDTMVGEFRVHYAGFFDPGFGFVDPGGKGSRAVLEVRSHDVPFVLEHEQIIGWLRYERLTGRPDRLYGPELGSAYQEQGLTLGKQFKPLQGL